MTADAKLYRGVFSFPIGIERVFCYAKTEKAAKAKMLFQLSKRHGVSIDQVYGLFDGKKRNFNIEIDKDWKEKQNGRTD